MNKRLASLGLENAFLAASSNECFENHLIPHSTSWICPAPSKILLDFESSSKLVLPGTEENAFCHTAQKEFDL